MASPQIDVVEGEEIWNGSVDTSLFGDEYDEEKQAGRKSSGNSFQLPQAAVDSSTPITYHYLTFETPLPSPSSSNSAIPSAAAPPQPNLKKYISPFDWSESRKTFILTISCFTTASSAFTSGVYSPGVEQMAQEWGVSHVAVLVGITTFCFGFGIAPMILSPFSEINGRYPVFVGSGIMFVICSICCAITQSYAGMLLARLGVGVGSSVTSSMVGGVVSDLYHAKARNTPMALFAGFALIGTGLGPFVGGFIAQNTSWRWLFWVQTIICGIIMAAVALFFKETRGSIILSHKAACLNKWYEAREEAGHFGFDMPVETSRNTEPQRLRWKVKSDEERESVSKMIGISVYRPFHLLFTEPTVFFFSLWSAFAWAVLYLTFGSIPLVFSTSHGFDLQQSNAVFAALCIGAFLATVYSIYQDRLFERYLAHSAKDTENLSRFRRSIDLSSPEGRLYFACIESTLLPIGLFWFGWSQFSSIHWIVPAMGVACATMGIYSIYLSTFNYLTDSYHRYASSALAAQSFSRNILGGVFPLVTVKLFNNLTFQGAASLLGGLAALLTLVPWVLTFYGPRIRARSKFASQIM